ncbi:MAG: NAD-dependent epimerase/dehydratase family protein [Thermoplasmata archaeon]|nr:NAD-dependent epimerase/dehydratase family protein [Thermoplasmata archaeon]
MKYIVTGGAGFIGSHIVDRLLSQGHEVTVIDNMTTGFPEYVSHHDSNPNFKLEKFDLKDLERTKQVFQGQEAVFHLAANADVRGGLDDNFRDLERNVLVTHNVLEAMRINDISKILFSSTAAVYGEPDVFPTPETYHPRQTSFYGASKLSCEGFIESFCEAYGFQTWMFRFVSIQGERHPHGVTYDFVKKLKADPSQMEIIGDGTSRKSYCHVDDCVDGFILAFEKAKGQVNLYNIGNSENVEVTTLAGYVTDEMGLENVKFNYTGGTRGWVGDSPLVQLDISKLQALGWEPKNNIEQTVRRTVRWLLANPYVYEGH